MNGFNMKVDLRGERVALTGAAGGIGEKISHIFAENGATLLLIDRDDTVEDLTSDLLMVSGNNVYSMVIDISISGAALEVAEYCERVMGGCEVLINNAAIGYVVSLSEMTPEQWENTMRVNLESPFLMAQAFANTCMIPAKYGKIINIASQAGIVALSDQSAYCVSKAGLMSLTRSIALEWGKYGIVANCIVPTVIETAPALNAWAGEKGIKHKAEIPIGRFGRPEEVAMACMFLASNASDMMSGSNLVLDGGYTIR
jgi:NAD(P)-dependent dehydrogenase (short-subunit alcohol dehydrogenase family)